MPKRIGRPPTTAEQFWAKAKRASNGCLLWQHFVLLDGYGGLRYHTRNWRAHRLAWVLAHGPIPDGLNVLHRCDTPLCIEPAHLFLGTEADNAADRDAKGRAADTGADHNGNAKLSRDQVVQIRQRCLEGAIGASLAREYGVSRATISEIKNRRHWQAA